jgi:hypothetical protein
MNALTRYSLLVVALLVSGVSLGFAPVKADELPEDTNKIESLTVEQARTLANAFPGVEVEFDVKGFGKRGVPGCLPLNGLKSLVAETARALAGYGKGPLLLNGLTTLSPDAAKALAATKKWDGNLSAFTALDSPDSVAIAQALATRKGPLRLPKLKKISPKTLTALIEKRDVAIPLVETLELIPEPDGSVNDDFVIPKWLEEQEDKRRRAEQAPE